MHEKAKKAPLWAAEVHSVVQARQRRLAILEKGKAARRGEGPRNGLTLAKLFGEVTTHEG
jgi:hypothetical protein